MPELPEVETVVRQLRKTVAGKRIMSGRILRPKIVRNISPRHFLSRIRGAVINGVDRRAKFILFRLDNGYLWIAHLGMTGKFVVDRTEVEDRKYVRAHFNLHDGTLLVFVDLRIFGMLTVIEADEEADYFRNIGVEPLGRGFTASRIMEKMERRGTPIKVVLLDQKIIAGIGNIYASEALFAAGIHPAKPANKIRKPGLERLVKEIKAVLKKSIRYNGTTILNYRSIDNKTGRFKKMLKVYGRAEEPCVECGNPIIRIVQSQRSTFYCRSCQKK